ncbi:MAG: hypothetical protein HY899_11470 [Deltaproteobacteria bacterium]|nr:hypothetical protein [Deltaproteobacteria bacterium]
MMSDRARRSASSSADDDGVRIVARDGGGRRAMVLYQAMALFLVACSAGYVMTPRRSTPTPSPAAARPPLSPAGKAIAEALPAADNADDAAAKTQAAQITTVSGRAMTPRRAAPPRAKDPEPQGDTTPDLSDFVPPGQAPTAGEVIEELHKRGIYEGIGAFPPPGTSPPMAGLAVPEDFELPEGYVRHFQSTDDGQLIDPILMFHPDYEFYDANGQRIPIPENRVVPPELAPPGLPIREIEIPRDLNSGDLLR